MRILTGKAMSRRTLLRGLGATVALPFLDAMIPHQGEGRPGSSVRTDFRPSTYRTGWPCSTGLRPGKRGTSMPIRRSKSRLSSCPFSSRWRRSRIGSLSFPASCELGQRACGRLGLVAYRHGPRGRN